VSGLVACSAIYQCEHFASARSAAGIECRADDLLNRPFIFPRLRWCQRKREPGANVLIFEFRRIFWVLRARKSEPRKYFRDVVLLCCARVFGRGILRLHGLSFHCWFLVFLPSIWSRSHYFFGTTHGVAGRWLLHSLRAQVQTDM
jgi:hypothetical protein